MTSKDEAQAFFTSMIEQGYIVETKDEADYRTYVTEAGMGVMRYLMMHIPPSVLYQTIVDLDALRAKYGAEFKVHGK